MKSKIIAFLLLIAALTVSLWFNVKSYLGKQDSRATTEVVCDTITDTVTYYKPIAKDSVVLHYVVARLPVSSDTARNAIFAENYIQKNPQIIYDSAAVIIPISQKRYADSTYTAWVSGYEARLDSITVFPRTIKIREREEKPPNRWSIGVSAGYGYTRKGLSPFIGVGITYSIISF